MKLKNKARVSTLSMSNVNLELSLEVMIKLTYYHRVSNNIKNIISFFLAKKRNKLIIEDNNCSMLYNDNLFVISNVKSVILSMLGGRSNMQE